MRVCLKSLGWVDCFVHVLGGLGWFGWLVWMDVCWLFGFGWLVGLDACFCLSIDKG